MPSTPLSTFIDDVRHSRVVDVLVPVRAAAPATPTCAGSSPIASVRDGDEGWSTVHTEGAASTGATSVHRPTPTGNERSGDAGEIIRSDDAGDQTSRKRRIAMAEPMEPIAMPTMTTTTLVSKTSDPDMCIAVKMLLVVRPLPSWLMKR